MINVKDRLPTIPNRRLITPDSGTPFYATIERADEPEKVGTPVNRSLLMALQGFCANETVFNTDGSISETNGDGDVKVTVFNSDGSITETFTSGAVSIVKKTTFNEDGSITEELI